MKWYAVFLASVAGAFVLGWLDLTAGYEFGFFIFYYAPVAVAAWYLGVAEGCFLSVLSAGIWCLADHLSGHSYSSTFYVWWNAGIRLVSFLILAVSLSTIHRLLSAARDEVRTLRGFLRLCAWCRKIANPEGQWVSMETFFQNQTEVKITHGLCPACAEKCTKEFLDEGAELPRAEARAKSAGRTLASAYPDRARRQ